MAAEPQPMADWPAFSGAGLGCLNNREQLFQRERFGRKLVSSAPNGAASVCGAGIPGGDNHRNTRVAQLEDLQELQPVHRAGPANVADDQVQFPVSRDRQRLSVGSRLDHAPVREADMRKRTLLSGT